MKLLRELAGASIGPVLLAPVTAVAVAASLFMTWKAVQIRNERIAATTVAEGLTHWGDVTCASMGVVFRPAGEVDWKTWGVECSKRAGYLARFEFDSLVASNKAAQAAIAEQNRKQLEDLKAARQADAAARRARKNMETINARVPESGQVDCHWFAGLNVLAGLLRPEGPACAPDILNDGPISTGGGDALRGPVDLSAGS